MHLLTSNFNLLHTNSNWDELKKKNFDIDSYFNNFFFHLSSKKILAKYESIHTILNFERKQQKIIIKKIKNLLKKKYLIKIYFYISAKLNKKNMLKLKQFLERNIDFKKNNLNFIFLDQIKFDERNKKYLGFPYNINAIKEISKRIYNILSESQKKNYKLIILDCDNTLWGGILDEDGKDKIIYSNKEEGLIYKKFQKYLKSLKKKGFLLSISSKNEESKVWEVMKNKKMILQKNDFIYPKINWLEKNVNIKNILSILSLREEDTLFIDDNIVELQKVKNYLRKISCIQFDKKTIFTIINKDLRLKKHKILQEDKKKYYQYKLKAKFDELKDSMKEVGNNKIFIKSLKQQIKFLECKPKYFERTLQLLNKTNQFNFSLNRFDKGELLEKLKNKNYLIKLINFKDKFGDHGIVGLYVILIDKKEIIIKDFLLSCRVLLRYIEDFMIYKIVNLNKKKKILIEYNKTTLNNNLIPKFLLKTYFNFYKKKNKNVQIYKISNNYELNETKKIFN